MIIRIPFTAEASSLDIKTLKALQVQLESLFDDLYFDPKRYKVNMFNSGYMFKGTRDLDIYTATFRFSPKFSSFSVSMELLNGETYKYSSDIKSEGSAESIVNYMRKKLVGDLSNFHNKKGI